MTAQGKTDFVYVTYIRTTAERLWTALTDPTEMREYWFGMHQDCDFKPGSPWRLVFSDGRVADAGKVLEADPPRRLVLEWQNEFRPELKAEGPARCTYQDRASGRGSETDHHPRDRAAELAVYRRRIAGLAEDRLEPEVAAGNRQRGGATGVSIVTPSGPAPLGRCGEIGRAVAGP